VGGGGGGCREYLTVLKYFDFGNLFRSGGLFQGTRMVMCHSMRLLVS